jgi:hypothetical protein
MYKHKELRMLTENQSNPLDSKLVKDALPLVEAHLAADQFKTHIRKHRMVRDSITGDIIAGMYDNGSSPGTKNNLLCHIQDELRSLGMPEHELDKTDIADAYDYLREREMLRNNGKSMNSEFWACAWGIYTSYMMEHANKTSAQGNLFNKLFTTKPLT